MAEDQAAVKLGDFAVFDFLIENAQGRGVFGRQHQTAGIAVNSVAQGGHKAVAVDMITASIEKSLREKGNSK